MIETDKDDDRLSTGVQGLDSVLSGGLIPGRGYMIRGEPGAGKTILSLHVLRQGIDDGETALYINLEEDEEDIRRNAAAVGIDLGGFEFLDLSPKPEVFLEDRSYSIFEASDVEEGSMTQKIVDTVREVDPDRIVVDPVTQFRHLSPDEYQFRKQVTGFMQFLKDRGTTVLFTSQAIDAAEDEDLQFISHGVIDIGLTETGRWLRVPKFRGSETERGRHTMRITESGIDVYPTLSPSAHSREYKSESISSGVPGIDQLLHGGIGRGTVTVISGPTGVGKTSLGAQFMKAAAGRGEQSAIFQFEESSETFFDRLKSINIPVEKMVEQGTLVFETVEPLTKSPDEFAHMVRQEVETRDAELVMIDGTAGYRMALHGEDDDLVRELHRLCRYLKNMGVTVILVEELENITGEFSATDRNISYIADTIVFLQYLEIEGKLRKSIGVLKNRTSDFERNLREFRITKHGITVGDPLTELRGILSGTPDIVPDTEAGSAGSHRSWGDHD